MFAGGSGMGSDTVVEAPNQGSDTIDFSGMSSAISINLASTATQLAIVGSSSLTLTLSDAAGLENVLGSDHNDTIIGNVLNNTLTGGAGTNVLTGGLGDDTYVFTGVAVDTINENPNQGIDTLDFSGVTNSAGVSVDLGSTSAQTGMITGTTSLTLQLSNAAAIDNVIGSGYVDHITGQRAG